MSSQIHHARSKSEESDASRTPSSGVSDAAPSDHPAIAPAKIGVLLINLGTPEGTDAASVRRYLREFLSDRRVVNYPRLVWLPVLHGIVLNTRPAKTGRAYAKIWRKESNESPLRYYTRMQAKQVSMALSDQTPLIVDWAMRYGVPSIKGKIDELHEQGCTRIVILPLYPQYSATTTATVNDEVFRSLMDLNWQPAVRTIPAFHDEPAYIEALKAVTNRYLTSLNFEPERMVLSFHGLPERYFNDGDPYHCHCAKTARLLRDAMGWTDEFAPLSFQSKFGPEKWLGPATDDVIVGFADQGIRNIGVIMPGFVADCIETLEEIAIASKEIFMEHGGENLVAIPCLNDAPEMTDLLRMLVMRELGGWI